MAACAGSPLPENPHFSSQTVTVTDRGLQPGAELAIADFGTVVFRNGRSAGDVAIAIARPFEPSAQCSTTLQFFAQESQSVSLPLSPHGVASICFHESGSFPFVVTTPEGELRGTVIVGGAQ
jgi:hypothetical protein